MHRYVNLAHEMLSNNYTGLLNHAEQGDIYDPKGFGIARSHESHISLQWLYERYPRNNTKIIWETMELMIEGSEVWGADWRTFWTEESYPKVLSNDSDYNLSWVFLHGVNHAQGKTLFVTKCKGRPCSPFFLYHDQYGPIVTC